MGLRYSSRQQSPSLIAGAKPRASRIWGDLRRRRNWLTIHHFASSGKKWDKLTRADLPTAPRLPRRHDPRACLTRQVDFTPHQQRKRNPARICLCQLGARVLPTRPTPPTPVRRLRPSVRLDVCFACVGAIRPYVQRRSFALDQPSTSGSGWGWAGRRILRLTV